MMKFQRKFVFVIASAFFLSAVGLPLFIHISQHHKDNQKHDSDKCPICQQAVANKTKVILPAVYIAVELPQITIANVDAVEIFVKNFKFITPFLRAPPTEA